MSLLLYIANSSGVLLSFEVDPALCEPTANNANHDDDDDIHACTMSEHYEHSNYK